VHTHVLGTFYVGGRGVRGVEISGALWERSSKNMSFQMGLE